MPDTASSIRNAVRALVIQDEKLLLLHKRGEDGRDRYALPGGAQEPGETLQQSLKRECLEEIGSEVIIRDLLHVADYFKPRSTQPPSTRQQVEFLFLCEVPVDYRPRNGHHPDKHQVSVEWAPLSRLRDLPLLPISLAELLGRVGKDARDTYQGTLS